jgi:hypothetical protein
MKWDRREAFWQARRAFRLVVIIGCCFAALDYALDQTQGVLAGLLVIIGAIAVGVGWAKVWPAPRP